MSDGRRLAFGDDLGDEDLDLDPALAPRWGGDYGSLSAGDRAKVDAKIAKAINGVKTPFWKRASAQWPGASIAFVLSSALWLGGCPRHVPVTKEVPSNFPYDNMRDAMIVEGARGEKIFTAPASYLENKGTSGLYEIFGRVGDVVKISTPGSTTILDAGDRSAVKDNRMVVVPGSLLTYRTGRGVIRAGWQKIREDIRGQTQVADPIAYRFQIGNQPAEGKPYPVTIYRDEKLDKAGMTEIGSFEWTPG